MTNTKESIDVFDWRVYPNPTHDFINIESLDNTVTSADIFISDASGRLYVSSRFSGAIFQQDIKILPSGIYFLTIKFNNKSTTTQFIKI
jgi:hypothetical protein